ncbi:nitroreductase family protein [Lachnospiraceae bacterium SGI.085]
MIKNWVKNIFFKIFHMPYSWYQYYVRMARRTYEYSSASKNEENLEWIVTKLKILTHEIDKGLAMPKPRMGFGNQKVSTMVKYMEKYLEKDTIYEYDAYLDAREILEKYVEAKDLYKLDTSMINFDKLPKNYTNTNGRLACCNQIIKKNCSNLNFKEFAEARHSVRYFKKDMQIEDAVFREVLEIARTAPSACNRQSILVKLINEKEIADKILKIQGGTAGFENADNCVLIIADLNSYCYDGELNTAFVDAGIFMMNLIYSLKYFGIESCPLIWDDNSKKRNDLKNIIELTPNLMIAGILAIGYADDKAKVLCSPRKSVDNILL